jgi:hypothetical protein
MDSVIAAEIAKLETMTVSKLVERFESLVGEKCRSRNKRYLVRRIAWRLQANAEGGLSERALKRAAELALDSEVRVTCVPRAKQRHGSMADQEGQSAVDGPPYGEARRTCGTRKHVRLFSTPLSVPKYSIKARTSSEQE